MTVAIVTQLVVKSWILIGLPENRTADGAQPRIRALVPRPFSLLLGRGLGTRLGITVIYSGAAQHFEK